MDESGDYNSEQFNATGNSNAPADPVVALQADEEPASSDARDKNNDVDNGCSDDDDQEIDFTMSKPEEEVAAAATTSSQVIDKNENINNLQQEEAELNDGPEVVAAATE